MTSTKPKAGIAITSLMSNRRGYINDGDSKIVADKKSANIYINASHFTKVLLIASDDETLFRKKSKAYVSQYFK
jgi:hypothetical protein